MGLSERVVVLAHWQTTEASIDQELVVGRIRPLLTDRRVEFLQSRDAV